MKGNNELVDRVAQALGWTYEEAGNFMGHFVAQSAEQLMKDIEAACEWASDVEGDAAIIDVMKKMPARSMKAKWNGGDLQLAIDTTDKDEVTHED